MPEYGSRLYWDQRYECEQEPFDWMCDFQQLEPTLIPLLAHKEGKKCEILIVGCGNANLSRDIYKYGFMNLINIDYCETVINQQKKKFPDMDWRVIDALNMNEFEGGTFDFVIDKSLIDTTLCYPDGEKATLLLFSEIHRVLKPGGRLVTISLHTENEVEVFKDGFDYEFVVSACKLKNYRKRKIEDDDPRSLYHTLAVFDKLEGLPLEEQREKLQLHPIDFVKAISDEEFIAMVTDLKSKKQIESGNSDCESDFVITMNSLEKELDEIQLDLSDVSVLNEEGGETI